MRLHCALFGALLLVLCLAPAVCDPAGPFHILGPGGGGAMYNPTISPHDTKTALVSCDMTGSYITKNGGESWRMFNLRGTPRFFVFDPKDKNVIYAQVTGLWRSTDGGDTWHMLYPSSRSLRGIEMNSDHAEETLLAEPDPLGRIMALAVDPRDSAVLYASGGKKGHPGLFVSRDRGESWSDFQALREPALKLWAVEMPRGRQTKIYAVTQREIVTIQDGISAISSISSPSPITDASLGRTQSGMALYRVSGQAAYVSLDDGKSWNQCSLPGSSAKVTAIATSFNHGDTAYLGYEGLRLGNTTWTGIAKTEDTGRTWNLVWKQDQEAIPQVQDAWITPTLGADWGGTALTVGVAQQDPDLCYVTDLGRTMRTANGGKSWQAVYSHHLAGANWQTSGLDVTTTYGYHFDPFDHKRQFITYTDIGLFRSEDAGRSWTSSIAGVPRPWWNTTYWIEFDPKVNGRMWSANSYTHDLPRPKMWRHTSPMRYRGGVCRSDDGGRSWIASRTGMPESAVTHILLDPSSPVNARTLYAAAFGRGVYKSTDGGASWQLKIRGIQEKEPFVWRLARANDGTLYVILARRSETPQLGGFGDGALYRSRDGGESWTPIALPSGVNGPNGLAIDPTSPKRLFLAAWARPTGMRGEGGGVYRSDDGGKSWTRSLEADQHIYDVTIDPKNSQHLYAAGFESAAWRSIDSGVHWSRIPGFDFKWAHRVVLDPDSPGLVYITTFGGSVWHGPTN
jgi:photosystem II stability/assembly factor-like uncharacterized protein